MDIDKNIKIALERMNFTKRYQLLSDHYNELRTPVENELIYIDGQEVMNMIQELGYIPIFDDKEKFYRIKEEKVDDFTFGVHVIIRDGRIDFVWIVKEKNVVLLGLSWGSYSRILVDSDYIIKRPVIGDYDDIEDILKISFEMYEDFKKEYLEIRSGH